MLVVTCLEDANVLKFQTETPCWISKFRNIWFYQEHCQMSLNWLRQAVILWKWANAFPAFSSLIEQPPCCLKPLNFLEAITGWVLPTLLIINMSLNVPGHFNGMLMRGNAVESLCSWNELLLPRNTLDDVRHWWVWVTSVTPPGTVQPHLHVIRLFYLSYMKRPFCCV